MKFWKDAVKSGAANPKHQATVMASNYLNSIGIKGLRYLDGVSRDADWDITPPSQTVSGKWMVKDVNQPDSIGAKFDTESEAMSYLNDVSRPTRNLVVFDDSLVKVLNKE